MQIIRINLLRLCRDNKILFTFAKRFEKNDSRKNLKIR
ncbi:hypothetical protein FM107_14870 [Sphingobacterium sp. JB170]|nr:hypothetical protein FM107_14870 [Sphingobacterium sp. JB170]